MEEKNTPDFRVGMVVHKNKNSYGGGSMLLWVVTYVQDDNVFCSTVRSEMTRYNKKDLSIYAPCGYHYPNKDPNCKLCNEFEIGEFDSP
jgi:hypothetical protein